MLKSIERMADNSYIKRIMDEQEIDELEVNLLRNSNTSNVRKPNTINIL
ncbi:MAG: hypothetical protein FWH18_08915 [Marinilabiliaceae bacterium]|nr:hypothetical protein [Marinilabiliaceae bacterium]